MPDIIVMLGESEVNKYHFDGPEITIGRAEGNDIRINNLSVSRRHAKIIREQREYLLLDLESSNGTYVNGVRVSRVKIASGDKIGIGKHVLLFGDASRQVTDLFPSDLEQTVMVSRARMAPALRVFMPGQREHAVSITGQYLRIGRGPGNDVRIADWFVDMAQAEIQREGLVFRLLDVSHNKTTMLNDMPVPDDAWLNDNDIIQMGMSRLIFSAQGAEGAQAPAAARSASARPAAQQPGNEPTGMVGQSPLNFSAEIASAASQQPAPVERESVEFVIERNAYAEESPAPADEDIPSVVEPIVFEPREESAPESALEIGLAANTPMPVPADTQAPLEPEPSPESVPQPRMEQQAPAPEPPPSSEEVPVAAQPPVPGLSDANRRSVAMWEKALENKSAVVRKQAAEQLKKLTGRDYAY